MIFLACVYVKYNANFEAIAYVKSNKIWSECSCKIETNSEAYSYAYLNNDRNVDANIYGKITTRREIMIDHVYSVFSWFCKLNPTYY